jgi:argininosuccinate lyase
MALLPVLAGALRTLSTHPERMRRAIDPSMLATDLADYLVGKGIPFRQAHTLAGQVVRLAGERGKPLDMLTLEELKSLDPVFGEDVQAVFDPEQSVLRREASGGTAPQAVAAQIEEARRAVFNQPVNE